MTASHGTDHVLTRWYRAKVGDPETNDEAIGYWLFALGLVAGLLGLGLFLQSGRASVLRELSVIFAAVGLVLLTAGPVIRLPLRPIATWLTYVGALVAVVGLLLFTLSYPNRVRLTAGLFLPIYAGGLLLIGIGGVVVPLVTTRSAAALDRSTAETERTKAALADTEADELDLAATLRALRQSQARFELFQGRDDQWRWRLRHRNGNVIADSGEGYTRLHNAKKGLASVRRNALGAAVIQHATPDAVPEPEATFEPLEEVASSATFEVYADAADEWRWRLVHDNGNILADSGEGYTSAANARRAVDSAQERAPAANYLRIDPVAFETYRDAEGKWRWRLLHRNGNILADSGDGYATHYNARRAATRIRDGIDEMEVEVYTDSAGEHRWRLQSGSDIVADSGEGYASRDGVEEAVDRLREYAPDADILEIGQAVFEVYTDKGGEARWRLRHRNGNILADSGEGYTERSDAIEAIEGVKRHASNADVTTAE
jgi:uncharacterized protein YegP (UPF0339 family)